MQMPQPPQPGVPESYLNYAAQLLEQMRGVYGSSWDNCSCGSSWHGGHNHFYDPCSGAVLRRQAVAVRYLTATPMSAAMSIITIIIHSRHVRRQCRTVAVIPQPIMMIAPIGCSSYVIS